MRKLVVFGALLALAAALIGCGKKSEGSSGSSGGGGGNSRERIVQNFCAAFRSCDSDFLSTIMRSMKSETKVTDDVVQSLIKMSKSKEPVKTKSIRSYKDNRIDCSIVEAKCEDKKLEVGALYFLVGYEKGGMESAVDKIQKATVDEGKVKRIINEMEEMEREMRKLRGGNCADRDSSREETARLLIINVELALKSYNFKHGKYPESLESLTQAPDGEDPLLEGDVVDPWGNELEYKKQGKKRPMIRSAGPDGEMGTYDDLTNYDPKSTALKVRLATEAISEEQEGTKAKDAVEPLDAGKIKRIGE